MTAPKDCLKITPEVATALGMTSEQIGALTLRQFEMIAYLRGYDVRVSGFDVKSSAQSGGLTVRMDDERRPILHVGG